MLRRAPAVRRRRWETPIAVAHSVGDGFGRALVPDTRSIDLAGRRGPQVGRMALVHEAPDVDRLPLAAGRPAVHHRAMRERDPGERNTPALVSLLRAPELGDALGIGKGLLAGCPEDDPERPSVEKITALAFGHQAFSGRWGDDPVSDWLRARLLRATERIQEPPGWLGILGWLGRHLDLWYRSPADEPMPLVAAALAATHGSARTLATVSAMLREARATKEWAGLVRALILRCALDGGYVPESLHRVVPSVRRGGDVVAAAWKPLLLARRALVEAGHVVGAAHLSAAFVATDLRRRVMGELRLHNVHARIPSWGSRALNETEAGSLHTAIHSRELRSIAALSGLTAPPWPEEWGGPDARGITSALSRLLGSDVTLAGEVFMHDGLALAALHALGGHAMNALAALGASRTPAAFDEARTALARAIHAGIAGSTLPEDRPTALQADSIYRQLRSLPDPSLALATPYWLLGAQRAEFQHALHTSGRFQQFRGLRLVLDRPDVTDALAPFWLLREEAGLERSLIDMVRRAGNHLSQPRPEECRRFVRSLE